MVHDRQRAFHATETEAGILQVGQLRIVTYRLGTRIVFLKRNMIAFCTVYVNKKYDAVGN